MSAEAGNEETVEELIKAGGMTLLMMTSYGVTCLAVAARHGHFNVVRLLLEAGGSELLRHTNPAPDLEFWKLPVVSGNLKIVKLLVETGGRELLMFCDFQGTCLHAASRSFKEGTLQVVQFLLQEGGRELLLKTTSDGLTCLHIAANVYLRPTCIIVVRVGREEEGVSSLRAELAESRPRLANTWKCRGY